MEIKSISKDDCKYEKNVMSIAEKCNKLQTSIKTMKENGNAVESFIEKFNQEEQKRNMLQNIG